MALADAGRIASDVWAVVRCVQEEFFPLHQLRDCETLSEDKANSVAKVLGYALVRGRTAQGDLIVFVVVAPPIVNSTLHSVPELRKALDVVFSAVDRLAEMYLVGNPEFASRKANTNLVTKEYKARGRIALFEYGKFVQNPLTHVCNPGTYQLLDADQRKQAALELCASRESYPLVTARDAVSVWLRAVAGDVLRVERPSPSAGSAVQYYQVV